MPNKITTVLLTEAGGPAGVSAIKSFRKVPNVKIVGMDYDALASGLLLCDKKYTCPLAKYEKEYKSSLLNILDEELIDFIIPTGESGLQTIASLKGAVGCEIYLSDLNVIKMCQNKWVFYNMFKDKLPLPLTLKTKVIKKLISSSGSKSMSFMDCESDYIIQEFIEGTEYTVDAFYNEGKLIQHTIRERVEIRSGISVKSSVVKNDKISELVTWISDHLICFHGPVNIQLIKQSNGKLKLIEINPRLAGTSIVTTLAGFNFAEYYYNLYNGLPYDILPLKDISVSRFLEEIVI